MIEDTTHRRLIDYFRAAAQKYPKRIALEIDEQQYSYDRLAGLSEKIADCILKIDGHEPFAGVLAYRSLAAYVGILGVLNASKGYVPLNPRFPFERNRKMIERSGIRTMVVGEECLDFLGELIPHLSGSYNFIFLQKIDLPDDLKNDNHQFYFINEKKEKREVEIESSPDDYAYLLFTSGSTGEPKAVAISNRNVCSYLDNITLLYQFSSADRFSQTFDLTFDLSVHDLFVCWSQGACLCIPPVETGFAWPKYIREKKLSVWFSVPSLINMLGKLRLLKAGSLSSLRYSFFCGEALDERSAEDWLKAAPVSGIINLYGPTESTIAISHYQWDKADSESALNGLVSIGRLFAGNNFYLMPAWEKPAGEEGELLLSGNQVINEYYQDQMNTQRQFIQLNHINYYKTGDLVKKGVSGKLFYLGRLDQEVKVSGYRVNLLEINHLIREKTGLGQIISVFHKKNERSAGKIITFILDPEKRVKAKEISELCNKYLPWYMVPEVILPVEKFYYNVNGKTNKQAMIEHYL
ncbi:MAG: AMP-binding protein [Bacteroidales bacterium]|nr:AMP-binding protein [Bacteroidales bacterium]MCF8344275.1 AMP-binding protein [Bacteroidales bacterium]MCF8351655.1 AMP-binding protein [Bacteroidales bacterium]MCF8375522.1 AMP-binding protein [Bacteroidales bacterium]MCF8399921.1 AMP-binding protein [Bacteroidales bacterium]